MKLTIFAATGGIGRQVLDRAVAAGHDVTAVVRDPTKLSAVPAAAETRVVTADLAAEDQAALELAIQGADGILSGLGPRSNSDAGIAVRGTQSIVAAMKATSARRIVVISAGPVGTMSTPHGRQTPRYDPGDGFFMRHLFGRVAKVAFGKVYADLAAMEDVLYGSGLDWTVVRPPKLTNKPSTGRYRTALGHVRGGWSVPRADVAQLMLRVLDQPETIERTTGIAT